MDYLRIIASWFNTVGDTMTVNESILELEKFLKYNGVNDNIVSDIIRSLRCGKLEFEDSMKEYLLNKDDTKELIASLDESGVNIDSLPKEAILSLKSIKMTK